MTITDLIIDFQNTARIVAEKSYEKYGTKQLLLGVRSDKTIPSQGSLDIIKNYSFHGCGLYAKLNGVEVDFDFGDNDRVDGFDAWRLKSFAESKKNIYPDFVTEKSVQIELDKLAQLGQINKPGTFPGSSNYYWVK